MPIAIDLFSGAGGLAEGLEAAGIYVAAAVELHPQPALTHAFNHPGTEVLVGDMRQLSMELLADRVAHATGVPHVDLVVGGPPCQGFSTAGKKIATDPRNSLFREFARAVEYFRPAMFLLENVPGFRKMHNGQAFAQASAAFTELGYTFTQTVLNATPFGIPQRRQRFVMVGWLPDRIATPFTWPAAVLGGDQPSFFTPEIPTVFEALEDIAFLQPGWESHRHQTQALSTYQRTRRNGSELLFNHLATKHRQKAVTMFEHMAEGANIGSVPEHLRSGKQTMSRLARNSVSNAVLAMPDDMVHYRLNRIPTVREMARLQSFDDDYVFLGKRTSGFTERRVDVPQYTQVGNAVPPLLAKGLGEAIMASFGLPSRDIRPLAERRARHHWLRGSSGFAGYTFDPAAEGQIVLHTIEGEPLPLPIDEHEARVVDAEPLHEWVSRSNPFKGQWAPGVTPRDLPSHMALEEIEIA
jgi:DNA (cytosine-5)-methyltransferase 1